ncbi:aldehyde dehydrogenase [Wilcoxina mikolae CBS 423.85]|nr:aldehyde dehydrogenase [Wilcoxina mikolae CBS 423.85]
MSTETITTISPITNSPILTRQGISEASFSDVLATSTNAFSTFRHTHPLSQRQEIVKKALSTLLSKQDELAKEITQQMGRPIAYTAKEVATAVKRGEYLLKVSSEVLADTPGEEEEGFRRWIRKEPLGPVLVVFAWNYPYLILINSLVPALLAGNTLLLKPSPQTPTIAEHMVEIFAEAGLPEGVLQTIHCGNLKTLEKLVARPEIRSIAFTGSVAGGIAIQKAAASRVVPVGLELGGNDPAYVRADVDVAWAAEEIVDGAVFNSGQSCCSIERVYVHESVYEEFLEKVVKVLEGYKLGDPFDPKTHLGPVVAVKSAKTISEHVADAVKKGARLLTPDVFADGQKLGETFVRPELLADCTHEMRVMNEETFGPIIPVQKVSGDEEAIRLMNDSEFGLTASVWTKDVEQGEALVEKIEAGTVFVNRCDYPSPDLAWTGWKNSGRGQTLSKFGFDAFVRLKSFHLKNYPK